MIHNKITYSFFLIMLTALLFSCNQGKIKNLEEQNSALLEQAQQKDSLLGDFMNSFEAFENNLDLIKERESLISLSTDEAALRENGKESILNDISMIDQLLAQNKLIIDELNQKLESSDLKLTEFRQIVSRLKNQLSTKDEEVASLKENLAEMDFTIESLNRKVDTLHYASANLRTRNQEQANLLSIQDSTLGTQQQRLEEQISRLNTAYFIAGTAKELKAQNILDKKTKINRDFNASAFTPIDITKINSIPVDTKNASLVTSHPSDSYTFNREDKKIASLEITNPEKFWKASKYLVLVLD